MTLPSLAPLLHPLQLTKPSSSCMQRACLLSLENCQVFKVWDKIFPFIRLLTHSIIHSANHSEYSVCQALGTQGQTDQA